MQRRVTWQELEDSLASAWREVNARGGSFADAPCEPGEDFDTTLGPMFPLEKPAHHAIDTRIDSGSMPIMFPAANRYAEIKLICAIGLVRHLAAIPSMAVPAEWSVEQALRWLLFDVHADTVQVALDDMRHDLLGGTTA